MLTKIFIISDNLMFSRGLESLLSQQNNLRIVGQEGQINRALERISALEPDVVLLDNTAGHHDLAREIIQILGSVPCIKVIGLTLQNNQFTIYRASQWMADTVDDLLAAVENDPAPLEAIC